MVNSINKFFIIKWIKNKLSSLFFCANKSSQIIHLKQNEVKLNLKYEQEYIDGICLS